MQVISIGNGGTETDTILAVSQQIETSLAVGREQIRKLRSDILTMQARQQQALIEGERKIQEGQSREQQLGQKFSEHTEVTARRERILSSEAASQRQRADALQRDLDSALRTLDQVRTDARQKAETSSQREERSNIEVTHLSGQRDALKNNLAQLQSRAAQLQDAVEKGRGEVELYKTSWARVLQMERDARAYLQKKEETEAKVRSLEVLNNDLLSEAKNRIRELENAKQNLISQLEESRRQMAETAERLEFEQRAAAEERANAGCALRAAEEERARNITAQNTVAQVRELFQAAVNQAREKAKAAEPAAVAQQINVPVAAPFAPISAEQPATEPLAVEPPAPLQSASPIEISDVSADFERITSSRALLEAERDALKTQLEQATREMNTIQESSERIRHQRHPLRDLLSFKESELTTAVRVLKHIDPDSPARAKAEEVVEKLSEQRDHLRAILRDGEPDLS